MINNISISDIKTYAKAHTASEFEAFCLSNRIGVSWLDVTLTDFNDGYYNVQLPYYDIDVIYYDGVLEEIVEY
jgi:hypothetical protein